MTQTLAPPAAQGMQLEELLALPVMFNLDTANRALRIGRTKGFALAREGLYPCPVKRIGAEYRVARADLLRELGIDPSEGLAGPVASAAQAPVTREGAQVAARTPSNESNPAPTSAN